MRGSFVKNSFVQRERERERERDRQTHTERERERERERQKGRQACCRGVAGVSVGMYAAVVSIFWAPPARKTPWPTAGPPAADSPRERGRTHNVATLASCVACCIAPIACIRILMS